MDIFSNYFSETDLIKLENLLNGKPVIGKLVFNAEVSKLFDAFKRLIEHKIIRGKKRIIERWLSSFFSYKSDNKIKLNFTPVHAHQIISHKDIICQKPIPEFESWLKDKNIFIPKKK